MGVNLYCFVTHWRFEAAIEEVADILEDTPNMSRWWPSAYRQTRIVERGGRHALGQVVEATTRGFLPYSLRWRYRVVEERYPYGSEIEALGDLVGTGMWNLVQVGTVADVTYEWRVRAEHPLLRWFGWLLRPLFAANHAYVMRDGERGLRRELILRRSSERVQSSASRRRA